MESIEEQIEVLKMIEDCLDAEEKNNAMKLVRKYFIETQNKCLFEVMLDKLKIKY